MLLNEIANNKYLIFHRRYSNTVLICCEAIAWKNDQKLMVLYKIEMHRKSYKIWGKIHPKLSQFHRMLECVSEREFEYVRVESFLYSVTWFCMSLTLLLCIKGSSTVKAKFTKNQQRVVEEKDNSISRTWKVK